MGPIINLSIEEDLVGESRGFLVPPTGLSAQVDPKILERSNFWEPVQRALENIKLYNRVNITEVFRPIEESIDKNVNDPSTNSITFKINKWDLESITYFFNDPSGNRLDLRYTNSPVTFIQIRMSPLLVRFDPFIKSWIRVSKNEWLTFIDLLSNNVVNVRDEKIKKLTDGGSIYSDYIRQAKFVKFIRERQGIKSSEFIDGIIKFYESRGYLTDKQLKSLLNIPNLPPNSYLDQN